MEIRLCLEDISVFRRIYSDKPETVEYMYRFGSPLDKIVAKLIKQANEGKAGVWSLSDENTWRPVECV